MNVDQEMPKKEIVTVAEMARMCHLSRSRFYGLIRVGIMPTPLRNPTTKRPFFNREQQEQCLLVRRTNCGINGKPILFYACHWSGDGQTRSTKRRTSPPPRTAQVDPMMEELLNGLGQLGVTDATEEKIREMLAETYPDGYANVGIPTLLMTVFRRMKRLDLPDNVA